MKKILVILALICAFRPDLVEGQLNVTYSFQNFTGYPQSIGTATLTPIVPEGGVVVQSNLQPAYPSSLITGTNGQCTFSNVTSGYAYQLSLRTPYGASLWTNFFPLGLTGNVNGFLYTGLVAGFASDGTVVKFAFFNSTNGITTNGAATGYFPQFNGSGVTWVAGTGGGVQVAPGTNFVTVTNAGVVTGNVPTNAFDAPGAAQAATNALAVSASRGNFDQTNGYRRQFFNDSTARMHVGNLQPFQGATANQGLSQGIFPTFGVFSAPTNAAFNGPCITNYPTSQLLGYTYDPVDNLHLLSYNNSNLIAFVNDSHWSNGVYPLTVAATNQITNGVNFGLGAVNYNPFTGSLNVIGFAGLDQANFVYTLTNWIFSVNPTTLASNAPAIRFALPGGATNYVIQAAFDSPSTFYALSQCIYYTNGLTPTNCIVQFSTNGSPIRTITLDQPLYDAQGIVFDAALNELFVIASDGNVDLYGIFGVTTNGHVTEIERDTALPAGQDFPNGLSLGDNPWQVRAGWEYAGVGSNAVRYYNLAATNPVVTSGADGSLATHQTRMQWDNISTLGPNSFNGLRLSFIDGNQDFDILGGSGGTFIGPGYIYSLTGFLNFAGDAFNGVSAITSPLSLAGVTVSAETNSSLTASAITGTDVNKKAVSFTTVPTARLGSGTASSSTYLRGDQTWATPGGGGTVTSVTFTGDGTVLSSTPSGAVTSSGTLTATLANAAQNSVLAGPASGGAAAPTYQTAPTFNGANITGLNASALSSGTVPPSVLPSLVLTNNETQPTTIATNLTTTGGTNTITDTVTGSAYLYFKSTVNGTSVYWNGSPAGISTSSAVGTGALTAPSVKDSGLTTAGFVQNDSSGNFSTTQNAAALTNYQATNLVFAVNTNSFAQAGTNYSPAANSFTRWDYLTNAFLDITNITGMNTNWNWVEIGFKVTNNTVLGWPSTIGAANLASGVSNPMTLSNANGIYRLHGSGPGTNWQGDLWLWAIIFPSQ